MRFGATWLVAALLAPGVAYAQNSTKSSCERQAKSICASAVSAHLSGASGDVLLSRGVGFGEIKARATLVAGDRLLVKKGSAEIGLGPACEGPPVCLRIRTRSQRTSPRACPRRCHVRSSPSRTRSARCP